MKLDQEVFYIPHLTVRIFPVIYKGPCERNNKCSRVIHKGAGDIASNESLFETKKEALEELLKRTEHLTQEVRTGLDKLAEEETNNVGRL